MEEGKKRDGKGGARFCQEEKNGETVTSKPRTGLVASKTTPSWKLKKGRVSQRAKVTLERQKRGGGANPHRLAASEGTSWRRWVDGGGGCYA